MGQFHDDPERYVDVMRESVPAYARMRQAIADAAVDGTVRRVLDLGAGTGETSIEVIARHPDARITLLDDSPELLAMALVRLPMDNVDAFVIDDLTGELPEKEFDLVVSSLAVHRLASHAKRDLFGRIRDVLTPDGQFVMGDVIVPRNPRDAITPLDPAEDRPERLRDLRSQLQHAGLWPKVTWQERDLAVISSLRAT